MGLFSRKPTIIQPVVQGPVFTIPEMPQIPTLPDVVDKTKLDVRYPLIAPYVNAHIYWDSQLNELIYSIEEPVLDPREKRILTLAEEGVRELINISFINIKTINIIVEYLEKNLKIILDELGVKISRDTFVKIMYYIYRDFVGLNELEPLMRDFFIEDIECNGVNTPIYIVHRKYRNLRTTLIYPDLKKLTSFVEKLAQKCGKYISYASPLLDGSLPGGERVNATYTQEISARGPTFTLRKFTKEPWSPVQLMGFKTLSPEFLAYIWLLIEYESNIMVIGGTGSGKTSLLNCVAFFIPPAARVVSIEDSVTGDSELIVKKQGNIIRTTISELTRNIQKNIVDINDIEVLTVDNDLKVKFIKPSKFIEHRTDKDIYRITTSTGRVVNVTKDHSIFTLSVNGLEEIKPGQLKVGESRIAVPRVLPIEGSGIKHINLLNHLEIFKEDFLVGKPVSKIFSMYSKEDFGIPKTTYRWWKTKNIIKIKYLKKIDFKFGKEDLKELYVKSKNTSKLPVLFELDRNFLKLIGLWLGDGSYDNYNKNAVIISSNEPESIALYNKISKKLGIKISQMSDNWSWRFHSTVLYKFMKYVLELDGMARDKRIPNFIYNLDNTQLKHFISGYFSSDGTVKKYEVACCSQSDNLLYGIQTLLLGFGIISRISKTIRKDGCKELNISSYENINGFKEIGFIQERQNRKLANIGNTMPTHTVSDVIPINPALITGLMNNRSYFRGCLTGDSFPGRNYVGSFLNNEDLSIPQDSLKFLNRLSKSDILWDRVVKIEKLPKKTRYVYDISVPGTEKFIAQNILLHNTRELMLMHENWLPSVARAGMAIGGTEARGEVDLFTLLKESFRQRPDYVIVGEVRGAEAYVLFQGMASGHAGFGTMHAENVNTMIKRLESPPINLSPSLVETLDAVCVMTQARVKDKVVRKVSEVSEIVSVGAGGVAEINTPFKWDPRSDRFLFKRDSKIFDKIALKRGMTREEIWREYDRRAKLFVKLYQLGIVGFKEVHDVISSYYKTPQKIIQQFGL